MGQWMSRTISNEGRLLHACEEGRYHQVASLFLQPGQVDVNCHDPTDGDTPLQKAARHAICCTVRNLHLVGCLLQHGADVNAVDRGGSTTLHWACVYGDIELVRLLVQYKANVQIRDPLEQAPLHKAHDCLDVVQYLIQDCHADPAAADCFGLTLADRLRQDLQHDLVAREFSNRRDGHAAHAQQVLEFLQSLPSAKANPTTTTTSTPCLEKKMTANVMMQIPEQQAVADNPQTNPQDGGVAQQSLGHDDEYNNKPALLQRQSARIHDSFHQESNNKPALLERQSARIRDPFFLGSLTPEEAQSLDEPSVASAPTAPSALPRNNENDDNGNNNGSSSKTVVIANRQRHKPSLFSHWLTGRHHPVHDTSSSPKTTAASVPGSCLNPNNKEGDGLLRDVVKSERIKL